MIDCFAFLFASWNPEFSLPLSLSFSETCYFFPLYFCVLVLLQNEKPWAHRYRNFAHLCFEIDLNCCCMSLCVFLTALRCGISPVLTLLTHRPSSGTHRGIRPSSSLPSVFFFVLFDIELTVCCFNVGRKIKVLNVFST